MDWLSRRTEGHEGFRKSRRQHRVTKQKHAELKNHRKERKIAKANRSVAAQR